MKLGGNFDNSAVCYYAQSESVSISKLQCGGGLSGAVTQEPLSTYEVQNRIIVKRRRDAQWNLAAALVIVLLSITHKAQAPNT